MRRGIIPSLLSLAVAAVVAALVSSAASGHHGSQANCSGTADVCRPSGVFTIPWSNSNPSACRFDVTVTWGDGTSTFVPDVRSGQSTSHAYAGHGFFTASTSAVITGANCTFSAGSTVIEVPAPPHPLPHRRRRNHHRRPSRFRSTTAGTGGSTPTRSPSAARTSDPRCRGTRTPVS